MLIQMWLRWLIGTTCNTFMLWKAETSSLSVRAGDILLDQCNGNLNFSVILHQRDIWDRLGFSSQRATSEMIAQTISNESSQSAMIKTTCGGFISSLQSSKVFKAIKIVLPAYAIMQACPAWSSLYPQYFFKEVSHFIWIWQHDLTRKFNVRLGRRLGTEIPDF